MKHALLTVCLGALLTAPAVAQTTTTAPAETPAAAATPAPATPAPDAASAESAPAAADAMPMPGEMVSYVTTEAPGSLYVSDLVGQSVYGTNDEKTGDINDILLDDAGNIEAVIIGVGGFIGLGEKDVAVTLDSLDIEVSDGSYQISINASEKDLEEAPSYTRADGTASDRLGAFERAYARTRVEAEKALDEASRRANDLYEKGRKAVNDLTASEEEAAPAPANAN